MEIKNLSDENVWGLTEEEAFHFVEQIKSEIENAEERNRYVKIIASAFEFRTVSSAQRALTGSLSKLGFQFFTVDKRTLRGICKRKNTTQSVF
jgi:hypothetical protein